MSVITELPQWLGETIKGQELAIKHLHKHSRHALICAAQGARSVRFCWPGQAV
jgi:hypothetical protein